MGLVVMAVGLLFPTGALANGTVSKDTTGTPWRLRYVDVGDTPDDVRVDEESDGSDNYYAFTTPTTTVITVGSGDCTLTAGGVRCQDPDPTSAFLVFDLKGGND